MQNFLAKSSGPTSSNKKQYSMFIGRWQPWHAGHTWLIDQRLNEGKNVLLCIRDVEPDEKYPWSPHEVLINLFNELQDLVEEGRVRITITPHHRPSLIETFEKFQDAKARVRGLRAELPAGGGVTMRMIFAEGTRAAQVLLTDGRTARTDGDD